VDAVLVAGDLVDRERRYAEAYGVVERAAGELRETGIAFVCVAGNHDHEVLPRLADDIDGLQLLRSDGEWESTTVQTDDTELHLDGWSFPRQHWRESPLETTGLENASTDDTTPRIGVVHADTSGEDRYAPVDEDELAATDHDAWLLGHLHSPGRRRETPPVLYPGSLQPLDRTETGRHGAWELRVDRDGTVTADRLTAATLQFESVTVSAEPDDRFEDVVDTVHETVRERTVAESGGAELFVANLTIEGRTDAHAALLERQEELRDVTLVEAGTDVRIGEVAVETAPAVDLADRAGNDDPVGFLAGLLRALDDESEVDVEPYRELIRSAHDRLRETHNSNAYRELREHEPAHAHAE
jgi:DNA repair exonuclease SbcCD nuclease subunit